jgi:hypothetical protein
VLFFVILSITDFKYIKMLCSITCAFLLCVYIYMCVILSHENNNNFDWMEYTEQCTRWLTDGSNMVPTYFEIADPITALDQTIQEYHCQLLTEDLPKKVKVVVS